MTNTRRSARLLYLAWIAVLVAVVWITLRYETQAAHFYGVAETKELVVNTETPVEIQKIAVVEGQTVEPGQLLVKLSSPEMTREISQLTHQIAELKAAKGAGRTEIRARIDQLRAARASKSAEINSQISQLQNQYDINKSLTSGLKSLQTIAPKTGARNPITLRVAALKRERALARGSLNIRIKALQQQLTAPQTAAKIQVVRLEQQLALLREESNKLEIFAHDAGVVGSVNFKPGAKVAPFVAILTLHSRTPSFIKGYIHENLHSSVALGDELSVQPINGGGVANPARATIMGRVVGVGNRIVALPVRLRKHQDLPLWGREIMVQIPEQNGLILGEKVMLGVRDAAPGLVARIFSPRSRAHDHAPPPTTGHGTSDKPTAVARHQQAQLDDRPIKDRDSHVEASAVHYLADLQRYLLLSDDTPHKRPLVHLMDRSGQITDELPITGLRKVNDLEAVTADEQGRLYLACSQSRSKGGKLKRSRRLLLRVTRQGKRFVLERAVDLYSLLNAAAAVEPHRPWARFIQQGASSGAIDLEGLAYHNGALLLGYKAPLADGRSLILRLTNIDEVLKTQRISRRSVSVFRRLKLIANSSSQQRISGLLVRAEDLFITSTVKGGQGSLWRVALSGGEPRLLRSFGQLRPEGLSLGADPGTIVATFDQGDGQPSRFMSIGVVP